MAGEALALLSALFYGLAGVAIVQGKQKASGDNGIFLSVSFTTFLSFVLWVGWGSHSVSLPSGPEQKALTIFAAAGVFSILLGRTAMYRATEQIGAINSSMFRRLIPIFGIPCAFLMLGEIPDLTGLLGSALIILGVLVYTGISFAGLGNRGRAGLVWVIGSALFYALAYSLRRLGMEGIPDPAFGTFVGAATALAVMLILTAFGPKPLSRLRWLIKDRGKWQWLAALALGIGQTMQFFALETVEVGIVAALGALDTIFAAVLLTLFFKTENLRVKRLLGAGVLAIVGTIFIF